MSNRYKPDFGYFLFFFGQFVIYGLACYVFAIYCAATNRPDHAVTDLLTIGSLMCALSAFFMHLDRAEWRQLQITKGKTIAARYISFF